MKTGEKSGALTNPAEIGTLILEFGTLSKITGNPVYYEKAKQAVVEVYNRRSKLDLVASSINVETGKWQSNVAHIGGCIDSYYEYLYKSWLLFGDDDFKRMWETHLATINKYLAVETANGLWYGRANMHTGEIVESAFYLYRITKNPKFLEMGSKIFSDIEQFCRTDIGYACIKDVRTKEQVDYMDSFFLSETLKYAYLLFAPVSTLNLDDYVFTTEAHPICKDFD